MIVHQRPPSIKLLPTIKVLSSHVAVACLGLALSFMFVLPGEAMIEMDQLSSPELSSRYRQLLEVYRCPKCQNQNLAGSDSPISTDLRREIRRMLEEGASDEAISDYLVARYGDFILYRPRLQQGTYLLWLGPGLFLTLGVAVAVLVIRRQRAGVGASGQGASREPGSLTPREQEDLAEVLGESTANDNTDRGQT